MKMVEYDFLGRPIKKTRKQSGIFGPNMNVGNFNPFALSSDHSEPKRDPKRSFGIQLQKNIYDLQKGKCKVCGKKVNISHMQFHHIKSWSKGGATTSDNAIGLCMECHKDVHDKERINKNDNQAKSRTKGSSNELSFGFNFDQPKRSKKNNGGLFGGF